MEQLTFVDGLIGASCSLSDEDVRVRLREWAALRDRALAIEVVASELSLTFPDTEPLEAVADLVERESECCPFYTFSIQVAGPSRRLVVSAGPSGEPAIRALLSLDAASISPSSERRVE